MESIILIAIVLVIIAIIITMIVLDCNIINHFTQEKDNKIILVPLCGLGNRIKVINSIYPLKNKYNIKYYWYTNISCNCEWDDVFSAPKLDFVSKEQLSQVPVVSISSEKWINNISQEIGVPITKTTGGNVTPPIKTPIGIVACTETVKSINTDFYKLLKPSTKVKSKLNDFFPQSGSNVIGIHIRYSDHPLTNKDSHHKIINDVNNVVKNQPLDFSIFIASDNQEIKDKLVKIYKNRKVFYQKTNIPKVELGKMSKHRASVDGMISSVADMFALAKCKVLWGNNSDSTFLFAAKNIKI
jgi:hypothetical protein